MTVYKDPYFGRFRRARRHPDGGYWFRSLDEFGWIHIKPGNAQTMGNAERMGWKLIFIPQSRQGTLKIPCMDCRESIWFSWELHPSFLCDDCKSKRPPQKQPAPKPLKKGQLSLF